MRASICQFAVSANLKTPFSKLTYERDYEKVRSVRARKQNSETRDIQRLIDTEAHVACMKRSEITQGKLRRGPS